MRTLSTVVLALVALATGAIAQETRSEISLQGTGFFKKDTDNRGITQTATDAGGFLVGYRYHFNRWLAAEANYGYSRNTQKFSTSSGLTRIQSNVHEVTGEVVATPFSRVKLKPYFLAGSGALVFDPTDDAQAFVPGADYQAKAVFLYGGGVDYDLTRHLALRVEYRGLVYKTPDFNLQALNADAVTHVAQPAAGIVFRF